MHTISGHMGLQNDLCWNLNPANKPQSSLFPRKVYIIWNFIGLKILLAGIFDYNLVNYSKYIKQFYEINIISCPLLLNKFYHSPTMYMKFLQNIIQEPCNRLIINVNKHHLRQILRGKNRLFLQEDMILFFHWSQFLCIIHIP